MKKKPSGFSGGVHPPERKITSEEKIIALPAPPKVVLPLIQHLGCAAKLKVAVGDVVFRGQKIAEPGGNVSAAVHASISGKVSAVAPWAHPSLLKPVESVVIESDGKDEAAPFKAIFSDYARHTRDDLRAAVADAGIVGMGGACFPSHVKMSPPKGKDIDYLILNGCECEPYLTADDALMRERAKEIIEGAKIISHIIDAYQTVIAVEENKPRAIETLKKLAFNEPNLSVAVLPVKYPQGAEKQLIAAVTGRVVPSGGLPFQVGCVVHNVATAYAVFEALKKGKPLYERVVSVSGDAVKKPGNYLARVGTLFSDIAAAADGAEESLVKVVAGGPMMGFAQGALEVPVVKGTSGVLFLSSSRSGDFKPCIRCAKCVMVCPMNLLPNMLSVLGEKELYDDTDRYYAADCIECGSCSFVCPSNRPIVAHIKLSKSYLCSKKS
ncbi:MAG: electron transport complex subunit RsxC [Endomicrobiia bacterium]|nr:electron transport complex subunit RsxC [Endomicrobiia bacterium]